MNDLALLDNIEARTREYRARVAQLLEGEDLATAETVATAADRVVQSVRSGEVDAARRAALIYSHQVTDSPFPLPVDVTRSLSLAVEAVNRSLPTSR